MTEQTCDPYPIAERIGLSAALTSERSKPEASAKASIAQPSVSIPNTDTTDQSQDHPTQGRRRRYKSPASISSTQQLPLPRLLDHVSAADGPSDAEEEEVDAKRQRSSPTTPKSTSRIFPHENDEVMGITPDGAPGSGRV